MPCPVIIRSSTHARCHRKSPPYWYAHLPAPSHVTFCSFRGTGCHLQSEGTFTPVANCSGQPSLVILTYAAVCLLSLSWLQKNDLIKINGRHMYAYFVINEIAAVNLSPCSSWWKDVWLLPPMSPWSELSNISNSLLRRMSRQNLQHSMQVASNAPEAANRIGAKASWYVPERYRDISKMRIGVLHREPVGWSNRTRIWAMAKVPKSSSITMWRTGWSCREEQSPKVIKDFITTHHGRGKQKISISPGKLYNRRP